MEEVSKHKHLEFIQNIITRMANNSFLLKGWSLTISTAIVGLATKGEGIADDLFMLLPIALFWCLDSYYLSQEKAFRDLYNKVIAETGMTSYSLDNSEFYNGVSSVLSKVVSITIAPFYIAQIAFIYFGFIS